VGATLTAAAQAADPEAVMVTFVGVVLAALALGLGPAATAHADDVLVPAVDTPWPGKIFVGHDEWAFSDSAFGRTPDDSAALARNVAAWFMGGRPGHFLVYSSNFGLRDRMLATTMRNAGHTWTARTDVPFTLHMLQQYDAVFLAGDRADTTVLIDYVRAGGHVFLLGGTGIGATAEAAHWNVFQNAFGLNMDLRYDPTRPPAVYPIVSTSPLFDGVTALYEQLGNGLTRLDPGDDTTRILVWSDEASGRGIYATYEARVIPVAAEICPSRVKVRSPGTLSVSIPGAAGLDVRTIDPASIDLFGARPQQVRYDYSAATRPGLPLLGLITLFDCADADPDQYLDVVLGFDGRLVVQGIERALGRALRDDETVALTLIGTLKPEFGGTPIIGEALIRIDKPRLLLF
jgi:hypothetical protein